MKDYKTTEAFLFKQLPMYQRVGAKAFKKDLKNIKFLLQAIGNPERNFKTVHIAGTNGKGSTAHFIAAILQTAGLKVGVYTSPHYKTYRERIKINGAYIDKAYVVNFVNRLKEKNIFESDLKPSFFEITVAMAFDYFSASDLDIAIIETGLGGRLDSTNVIQPLLSIITNIGYDHTQFLGDTLELIAGEKAGIIKADTPILIGERQVETVNVFSRRARSLNAQLLYAESLIKGIQFDNGFKGNRYVFKIAGDLIHLRTKLLGKYQLKNLRTAICASILLTNNFSKIKIDEALLSKALNKTLSKISYLGRNQVLSKSPTVIADSAHNREGIAELIKMIDLNKNLHIVFGTVNDKDPSAVLALLPKEAQYYFCKANIPRGLEASLLIEKAALVGLEGIGFPSVKAALDRAKKKAGKEDVIIVTGSIFVVAEVV